MTFSDLHKMKSDPPKGGTKNDSKLPPEETKVVRKEPELGAVEAGGAGDQLTIAEMENVTTVFRTNVNVTNNIQSAAATMHLMLGFIMEMPLSKMQNFFQYNCQIFSFVC